MGGLVIALTVLLGLIAAIGGVLYIAAEQRIGVARLKKLQQTSALGMERKARMAVYSSLAAIDGQPLDSYVLILGRKPDASMDAVLLLVEPGRHSFNFSPELLGDDDMVRFDLKAGHTYQVGAGFYRNVIVQDYANYQYKRVLASRSVVKGGLWRTLL